MNPVFLTALWVGLVGGALLCIYEKISTSDSEESPRFQTSFSIMALCGLILAVIYSDFELILTLVTLITGLVVLLGWIYYHNKGVAKEDRYKPAWMDLSHSFFPVLLIVLVIRSFIAEPFRIPSGSMIPTLFVQDFILVTKYSYGVKLPVLNKTFIETGKPERGDVVVFRYPVEPEKDYIKRVVGLPGDSILVKNNRVWINGELVPLEGPKPLAEHGSKSQAQVWTEILGSANHDILIAPGMAKDYVVDRIPEGHYFVMGDNRNQSSDSRFWGFVPEENLVGKARFIWMQLGFENMNRVGTVIN